MPQRTIDVTLSHPGYEGISHLEAGHTYSIYSLGYAGHPLVPPINWVMQAPQPRIKTTHIYMYRMGNMGMPVWDAGHSVGTSAWGAGHIHAPCIDCVICHLSLGCRPHYVGTSAWDAGHMHAPCIDL